jgi:hypothetical protein
MAFEIQVNDDLTGDPIDTSQYYVSIASIRQHNVSRKPYEQTMDIKVFSSNEHVKEYLDQLQEDWLDRNIEVSI